MNKHRITISLYSIFVIIIFIISIVFVQKNLYGDELYEGFRLVENTSILYGITPPTATSQEKNSIEILTIKIGEDVYEREMPTNIEEAQELIRMLTRAYEQVSNLSITYSEKYKNEINELITTIDNYKIQLNTTKDETIQLIHELNDKLIITTNEYNILKSQQRKLAIGPMFSLNTNILSNNYSLGMYCNYNLFNKIQLGASIQISSLLYVSSSIYFGCFIF